jgi:hypothetical protein
MGDEVKEEAVSKIAPELRKARNDGLVVMAMVLVLSLFLLDGGRAAAIAGLTATAYWAIFMFIVFLRGEKPILLDLLFARFGFLVIILVVACITVLLSKPA